MREEGGGSGTPKSPKLVSWRNDFLLRSPTAVLTVCQERASSQSNVVIPWNQVKSATVITSTVLSIFVEVHRYMIDKHSSSKGQFRSAEVEIFVSNCPAAELKSMIDERIWFDSFKGTIRKLVQVGTSSGRLSMDDSEALNQIDSVPETEQLSLGSELVAELDRNSIALENTARTLKAVIDSNNEVNKAAAKELAIILRRDCRLRLYMAALFGVGLKGDHSYKEEEIRDIIERDFKVSQNIERETPVATANNRIEYFLDTAEKRIRDAVLCGWEYRGGKLERCIELFANGYFIEIVGLMGSFFETSGVTAVKVKL
jgi:hypothetical protein